MRSNHAKIIMKIVNLNKQSFYTNALSKLRYDVSRSCTQQPHAATTDSYEIKPALLNLVMKDQFSGIGEADVALPGPIRLVPTRAVSRAIPPRPGRE